MNGDEEEYGISVSVWHPDAPKVEMRLSWPDEQSQERLTQAAHDLTPYVLGVSARMVQETEGDDE